MIHPSPTGDIEDLLSEMAKTTSKGFLGMGGAARFTGLDVKVRFVILASPL
jgi:hypothetical protein